MNKEARILGLSSNIPNRKRACTLERTSRTARKVAPATPLSSNASMKSRFSRRTSSAASDPSMDRFLTHIRASQEARAAKRTNENPDEESCTNTVFVDEREKGWLGDEPL